MTECEACGATVIAGARECPYCGHSFIKPAAIAKPETKDPSAFRVDRESGTIHFGDGKAGARPSTGKDKVTATYRNGGGASGNVTCSNCKLENPDTRINCEACGTPLKRPFDRLRR